MTTLHIMLASGENLPNLIPAITTLKSDPGFKADAALIVATHDMHGQAQKLKRALEYCGVRASIHDGECPDHDLARIRSWARAMAAGVVANHHDSRCIVNLTGGNKLMAIAFLEAFQQHRVEEIYCDTEHGRIEYIDDAEHDPALPVDVLKLDRCLAAQGYKLAGSSGDGVKIATRAAFTRDLAASAPKIDRLFQAFNRAWFEYDEHNDLSATVDVGRLDARETALARRAVELNLLGSNGTFRDEAAARYLGGGWLEEWCWLVGKELEANEPGRRLKGDRWGIGLRIDPFEAPVLPGKRFSLNELDAVFVHRNRMLLVECKTGMQVENESQNILNKLEVLGNQFGGRLNAKWLLSARGVKSPQARERARRYGIRIVGPEELVRLKDMVQEWMTR